MRLASKIGKHNYFNLNNLASTACLKMQMIFRELTSYIRVLYNYYVINISRRKEYDRLQGEKVLIARPLVLYALHVGHITYA